MEAQYLHATSATLGVQGDPKFTSCGGRLRQVDQNEPYRIACDGIEYFDRCASSMNFVARELQFTVQQGDKLLIALKQKNMRATCANIHIHAPS
jgi:hypothetical protein